MSKITVIGIGPGKEEMMTAEASAALSEADVIVGYPVYLDLLGERFSGKEFLSTPMRREEERCRICLEEAAKGRKVALISSGDAGIYGMASLMYEMVFAEGKDYGDPEIEAVAGITAASSGAAVLGAPLGHDFCCISLSDLLTPWELIEKRLRSAAEADFVIVLYNPSSRKRRDHLRKACGIVAETAGEERACGYVRNIGREGTEKAVCSLKELTELETDMFTTVFIGNSRTRILGDRLVTPRGYFDRSEEKG